METRYPRAELRLLGTQVEPLIGTPRILVFHTMAGYLKSTDALFRSQGYQGVEAHFGVGGPWDGAQLDGAVWQWQLIDHQADAQAAGNRYCTSIETSDGGNPDRPWTPRQLEALAQLAAWWCRQTGYPPRVVTGTGGTGFGYHCQFDEWNPNRHACPGPVRIAQLRDVIVRRVRELLTPTTGGMLAPGYGWFATGGASYTAQAIATRYGLTLDQLRTMNHGLPDIVPRNTPVKVRSNAAPWDLDAYRRVNS